MKVSNITQKNYGRVWKTVISSVLIWTLSWISSRHEGQNTIRSAIWETRDYQYSSVSNFSFLSNPRYPAREKNHSRSHAWTAVEWKHQHSSRAFLVGDPFPKIVVFIKSLIMVRRASVYPPCKGMESVPISSKSCRKRASLWDSEVLKLRLKQWRARDYVMVCSFLEVK